MVLITVLVEKITLPASSWQSGNLEAPESLQLMSGSIKNTTLIVERLKHENRPSILANDLFRLLDCTENKLIYNNIYRNTILIAVSNLHVLH